MAFRKPAANLTTKDSVGFGPYPGLSPKHGGQIVMDKIFGQRNRQEELYHRRCREQGYRGPDSIAVHKGYEVFQNSTYIECRPLKGHAKMQFSNKQAAAESGPPADKTASRRASSSSSPAHLMASTWPPLCSGMTEQTEGWVPGMHRRRRAPKGPFELPPASAEPMLRMELPKYALTKNTMWHMTERLPLGTQTVAGDFTLQPGFTLQKGPALSKYALTLHSMGHMKAFEENPSMTKAGQNLQRVLAKRSGSAPSLAATQKPASASGAEAAG